MGFTPSELERLLNAPSPVAPLPPVPAGTDPNCSIFFQDGAVLRVEDWWNISQDGSSKINTYHLSVGEVGTISLPSGKIVLRDFGYSLDGDVRPLARSVPPGDYPVEICVADNTCAAVRVVFNKAAQGPFSCHPALTVDHPEERGGWIGVDAANVTISDAVTFMRRTKREHARDDEKVLGEAQSRSWPNSLFFNLGTSARPNAVYIRSGPGDGAYPAYWVVDETDTTIALVVDFLVVAQWLKRTVRVNWPKGGTGIICEHSTPEGKTVSVRIDRAEESLIGTDNVEMIRFLDTNGRLIGDTNRVGGGFCGNERNWNMDLSRLDEAVTSLEIVVRAGYRNGGEPRGEAAP